MTAEELAPRIKKAKLRGSEWSGLCHNHENREGATPSLHWRNGDRSELVIHCKAGCSIDQIAAALGLTLPELLNGHAGPASTPVAEYSYTDAEGCLLYQVVRLTGKRFYQRRPDGAGGWINDMRGVERVLYRLPAVLATVAEGGTVYLCEGEKDADAINALEGLQNAVATTAVGGAGKWRPEAATALTGANVVIIQDKDDPGRAHAAQAAASLKGTAASVRIVEALTGKDAFDHLAAGHTIEQLVGRIRLLKRETLDAVLARPMPETPWAVEGLLCLGDIAMFAGAGGVGKSWISLYVALCLAAGKPLWGFLKTVKPYNVATLDLESRPWEIDQRLHRLAAGMDANPKDYGPRLSILRDRLRLDKPLDVEELIESMKTWNIDILIVDSMRRSFGGDENDSGAISGLFQAALDPLRIETNCAIIILDHVRKRTGEKELDTPDQALRGSTDKFNMSDLVIGAERREQYIAIYPSKGRHRGAPLEPFLVEFSGFAPDDPEDSPVAARYIGPLDKASDSAQDAILSLLNAQDWTPRGDIIGKCGMSERTTSGALSALMARAKIDRQKLGRTSFYRLKLSDENT